jgi:tetratricopeptide (TPR) repeat protein
MQHMQSFRRAVLWCCISVLSFADSLGQSSTNEQIIGELKRIQVAQAKGADTLDALRLSYKSLVQQRPGDVMLRVYLAWCDLPSDGAWNQLKQVLGVDSKNKWARYGIARTYTAWKMKEDARKELTALVAEDSRFFLALSGLGELARLEQDDALAEKQFRASLAVADNPWARTNLGLLLLAQGKKDLARSEFEKSLGLWAEQPKAAAALLSLYEDRRSPQAIKVLVSLAELEPKNREARVALAQLRDSEGKLKEATVEYERAIRLGETDGVVLGRLAQIYRQLGDQPAEERTLSLQAGSDKSSGLANVRLAELAMEKNDLEVARGQLLEALAREPKRAQAHLMLGELSLQANVLHEALEAFRAGALTEKSADNDKAQQACATQAEGIEKKLKLSKPATGTVNSISNAVSKSLGKFYLDERSRRSLGKGLLRVRVRIDAEGKVSGVDVLEDQVKDSLVLAHAYFSLAEALYPKGKREPVFEFELGAKTLGKK